MASIIPLAVYAAMIEIFTFTFSLQRKLVLVLHFFQRNLWDYIASYLVRLHDSYGSKRCSWKIQVLCFVWLWRNFLCLFSINHKAIEVKRKEKKNSLFGCAKSLWWNLHFWGQCRASCMLCSLEMTQIYRFYFSQFFLQLLGIYLPSILLSVIFILHFFNGCPCLLSFLYLEILKLTCWIYSLMPVVDWRVRICGRMQKYKP